MKLLVEFFPFLSGCALGLFLPRQGWSGWTACLLVGAVAAGVAGELSRGPGEAVACILFDSATAVLGCAAVRFACRFVRGSQP